MRVFAVFNEKYLQPYGWNGGIFTDAANCTNWKTEIKSEISEIQTVKVEI